MQHILEAKKLIKSYQGRNVVNELSFSIGKGEVVGLLGPNGAGKTTAFYMAMGLIRPDSGHVYFHNQEVTNLPMHERARLGMGYLAQEPSIFRNLTVEENLLCILQTQNLTKAQMKERLDELLVELHLSHLGKKKAGSLSGGERRRLEITRALITNPTCLLLDEPFANIDPLSISDVQNLIRHLSARSISVLITDHNAREIFAVATRCYLISEGRVLLGGTVSELVSSEVARRYYLGSDFKWS